ncbi:hypothetical protein HanIR_Chr14g0703351 [Helianthus annuus]|nr:hypothetical protein HanIR_Chr14g0703351 [Helianthus annuus]
MFSFWLCSRIFAIYLILRSFSCFCCRSFGASSFARPHSQPVICPHIRFHMPHCKNPTADPVRLCLPIHLLSENRRQLHDLSHWVFFNTQVVCKSILLQFHIFAYISMAFCQHSFYIQSF